MGGEHCTVCKRVMFIGLYFVWPDLGMLNLVASWLRIVDSYEIGGINGKDCLIS